jgi:dihydrofolate synthase/folylpolyglutamate synthase
MSHLLPLSLIERRPARIRPRLQLLRQALEKLGEPQYRCPSILIVGTNGKGSTAVMLDALLRAHGITTGLYTSPHLIRVEERIRIAGQPVSGEDLAAQLDRLDAFPELTFFETLTAAAFGVFADQKIDCMILEAGMGGRWDATRVAGSQIAGLTNVGTDHQSWLGPDREAIARDKASALNAARFPVLGPGVDDAIRPALAVNHALEAHNLIQIRPIQDGTLVAIHERFSVRLRPPFEGSHQVDNLHLAIALAVAAEYADIVSLDPETIQTGLLEAQWPGRLSYHNVCGRDVLLDGGHNLESAISLASHLEKAEKRPNLLFSCLDDTPIEALPSVLRPVVDRVAVCPLSDERTMPMERLENAFPKAEVAHDPLTALELLPDPVVATGSLRLIGALLRHSNKEARGAGA